VYYVINIINKLILIFLNVGSISFLYKNKIIIIIIILFLK